MTSGPSLSPWATATLSMPPAAAAETKSLLCRLVALHRAAAWADVCRCQRALQQACIAFCQRSFRLTFATNRFCASGPQAATTTSDTPRTARRSAVRNHLTAACGGSGSIRRHLHRCNHSAAPTARGDCLRTALSCLHRIAYRPAKANQEAARTKPTSLSSRHPPPCARPPPQRPATSPPHLPLARLSVLIRLRLRPRHPRHSAPSTRRTRRPTLRRRWRAPAMCCSRQAWTPRSNCSSGKTRPQSRGMAMPRRRRFGDRTCPREVSRSDSRMSSHRSLFIPMHLQHPTSHLRSSATSSPSQLLSHDPALLPAVQGQAHCTMQLTRDCFKSQRQEQLWGARLHRIFLKFGGNRQLQPGR